VLDAVRGGAAIVAGECAHARAEEAQISVKTARVMTMTSDHMEQ